MGRPFRAPYSYGAAEVTPGPGEGQTSFGAQPEPLPLERFAHVAADVQLAPAPAAHLDLGPVRAVKVAAARLEQAVRRGDAPQPAHDGRLVTRVPDLETVEAERHEPFDERDESARRVDAAGERRMPEHPHAPRRVHQLGRVARRELRIGLVRGPGSAQPAR